MTDFAAREAELLHALAAIPEMGAAGFRASADDVIGVSIMRRRSARGRWRAVEDGFAWIPANSEDIARIVPTTHEAVRETLLMVLISLQVKRRPPADAMKTAEAILPNPATRVA